MIKKWLYRASLLATAICTAGAALQIYLRIANAGGAADVFDLVDTALLGVLLILLLGEVFLLVQSWRKDLEEGFPGRFLRDRKLYWGVLIFLVLILLESVQDLFYLSAGLKEVYYPVTLVRNRNLLIWTAAASGQSILVWLILGWRSGVIQRPEIRKVPLWLSSGLIIGGGILAFGGGGSLPINAPLPALHVLLIVGGLTGILYLVRRLSSRFPELGNILHWDGLPLILLWGAAFTLWSNVPLQANYFLDVPRPPNQQYTPISDSIYYEIQAHRLLAGEDMVSNAQHPMYNYLLAGLHAVGGDHYLDIYRLQIALLALIPVIIFKLGKLMHSRFAGWLMAGLFIIREFNGLLLGDSITISNVQVLMTEPTALLGVALFLYLTLLWLKEYHNDLGMPVLIGSVIGLTALIRIELLSMGAILGILLLIRYQREWRRWLVPGMLALAALILVMSPWLVRNYQKTGTLSIEKTDVLQKRFLDIGADAEEADGEQVNNREQPSFTQYFKSIRKRLSRLTYSVGSSLKQTLMYYPNNHFPLGGMDTFVNIVPEKRRVYIFQQGIFSDAYLTRYTKSLPYWELRWRGNLTSRSIVPLLISITLVLSGFREAWKRLRWLGMLPALVMLGHISTYGLIKYSGGRFIQVVDWVTILYFSLGIVCLLDRGNLSIKLEGKPEQITNPSPSAPYFGKPILVSLVIFLVALSLPVVESSIAEQYSRQELEQVLDQLPEHQTENEILFGKVLYPVFFSAGEKFVDDRSGRMPEPGKDQLVFYLVGSRSIWVSLPVDGKIPVIQHGQEVMISGNLILLDSDSMEQRKFPYYLAEQIVPVTR